MGKTTGIEWTDSTWNPIRGCSRVSEGCRNCYAESVAARFSGPGQAYEGLAEFRVIGENTPNERVEPHWTGEVGFIEKHLEDPIRWKEPAKIFVNSMSDLFHPGVKDEWLARIFWTMLKAPQHTYQILTKRPERMLQALLAARDAHENFRQSWPPPNWWFGVSIEDQETAKRRLPILAQCPAAVRIVSYEPAIGPVDFVAAMGGMPLLVSAFDWIICGGESGPHARPMHPNWARTVRDQCTAAGVPFFFKQWGAWMPGAANGFTQWPEIDRSRPLLMPAHPGRAGRDDHQIMLCVGKHKAGSNLDGVEWKEFPKC
jgi:protein gp37